MTNELEKDKDQDKNGDATTNEGQDNEEKDLNGKELSSEHKESKSFRIGLLIILGIILILIGLGLYVSGGRFLLQLQDTNVSRGLITFLVAAATVFISIVLAIWVIATNVDSADIKTRFSAAKDILATLVGILGTILGFYFGSSDRTALDQMSLADVQFKNDQLITHVSGGTPPYRIKVSLPDGKPKDQELVSKDGWVFETLTPTPKTATAVTIEIIDSKDKKLSKVVKYQPGSHEQNGTSSDLIHQKSTPPTLKGKNATTNSTNSLVK